MEQSNRLNFMNSEIDSECKSCSHYHEDCQRIVFYNSYKEICLAHSEFSKMIEESKELNIMSDNIYSEVKNMVSQKKPNTALESGKSFSTKNIVTSAMRNANATSIPAGEITPEGIVLTVSGYDAGKGKYGEFHILKGMLEDGTLVDILTSSKKLDMMVNDHLNQIMNKKIRLSGEGVKFERNYSITLLD